MTTQNPTQKSPLDYLKAIEESQAIPNFWMSEEYITRKGLIIKETPRVWGLVEADDPDGPWFFPPFYCVNNAPGDLSTKWWAGIPGDIWEHNGESFLDYQFIYDPRNFKTLEGHHWRAFRREAIKWPDSHGAYGKDYTYGCMFDSQEGVGDLLLKWAGDREVFDVEVMIDYALHGACRWGLWYHGELVGLNVADTNWRFVNFRYCLDIGDENLQHYLRLLFYRSPMILNLAEKGVMVNDGGCLGDGGLETFKLRMNPIRQYEIPTTVSERKPNAKSQS